MQLLHLNDREVNNYRDKFLFNESFMRLIRMHKHLCIQLHSAAQYLSVCLSLSAGQLFECSTINETFNLFPLNLPTFCA